MPDIVLPHNFHDGTGEVASGAQVTENDETLRLAIEALGIKKVTHGEGEGEFTGGALTAVITHGLGATPTFAIATLFNSAAQIFFETNPVGVSAVSATTFTFVWKINVAEPPGKHAKYLWLAMI